MSEQEKDKYKDTVFLPKTEFPMRGGLPQKEPEILARWQEMDLYGQIRAANKDKPKWILHDGPPYANGDIHMGHALNKILKDVVVKSYTMLGYNAPYVPGWDCHGLPIEWKIEEQYRERERNKDDVDPIMFRDECRGFARKWVETQSEQFERLGVTGDWQNPYLTMTERAESAIVKEIHKFAMNGGLYKGAKPVMWSVVEQTALAEAEVEYKEHKSITIWVRFPVVETQIEALKGADVVIWTTTPWTIPSNRALAFGEGIEYGVYAFQKDGDGQKICIATSLADSVKEAAKIEDWDLVETFKGSDLAGTVCAHPLKQRCHPEMLALKDLDDKQQDPSARALQDDNNSVWVYDEDRPLLTADFVTDDAGTGFVHIAPGHGEDDFYLGTANGIEVTDNVSDDGKFREHVPLFAGLEVYTQKGEMGDGNFAVLKALKEADALLAKGSVRHEYPHSWRSGAPLIFRTTPQWFISMSENGLRDQALTEIAKTQWVPGKGEARIRSMIENRPDWCISRQRSWGVPIALFVHKETDEILRDEAVFARIAEIFEQEGSDAWWSQPAADFLGAEYNPDDYEQVYDIVDVWFESGSTHAFVCEDREELQSPADLYLEGSDQHRGWFHSSLLESVGTRGCAPYKSVLTHGFVLDDKGYKMSKSRGNVVDPLKTMEQYGADILRLWVMLSDFTEDIRIGPDSIKQTGDLYRRIRNTLRFLLGALDGFTKDDMPPNCHPEMLALKDLADEQQDPSARALQDDIKEWPELEQLVLHQLYEMDKTVRGHIENYEFGKLAKALHDFCNETLSAFYFDIRKDRLYCDAPDSPERRATRATMAIIYNGLTAWLAPILAFTAEEAWGHRPADVFEDVDSVHLREFPSVPESWHNPALAGKWFAIRQLREQVTAAIEPLRADKTIGSSLEALPVLALDKNIAKAVEGMAESDLADLFITSAVRVSSGAPKTSVEIEKTPGQKCTRCWKVLPEVASNGDLCNRCTGVVKAIQTKAA